MEIIFLTEAGIKKGIGHVIRCYAIAQKLQELGHHCTIILNKKTDLVEKLIPPEIIRFLLWDKEKQKLKEIYPPDTIVFIDSYHASKEFYQWVASHFQLGVYIDDYNRLNYPPGLIINWQIYANELDYNLSKRKKGLLGPKYSVLRKEFQDCPPKIINQNVSKILIIFGGTDPKNLISQVLEVVNHLNQGWELRIIVGKDTSKLKRLKRKYKNVKILQKLSAKQMKKEMRAADIAISGCGQTLYELAAVGVPTIGISVAKNQENNVNGWKKVGFLAYAGHWNASDWKINMVHLLKQMQDHFYRKKLSKIGQKFVNTKGIELIIKEIFQEIKLKNTV